MSRQAEAREAQGYTPKHTPTVCRNCAFYSSQVREEETAYGTYTHESRLRCSKGGFAVKKMGTCNEWVSRR
ncbi:hypothetical protein JLDANKMP_00897 [Stenotrophomonas sp. PE591]|nr:hypothetical protein [Stenotrophomonas sp. PE591]